ncbi:hypothetical protein NicSoilE8_20750 [Arthrobacter sp. NicSoilE8]|nr:hypothetical protein NicSoilE8_20750 [Arthrobacter sp. NicSoilE8]
MVIGITRRTKGADVEINVLCKHPAQFGYVDSGTTINFRREFFSHNVYTHANQRSRSGVCVLV